MNLINRIFGKKKETFLADAIKIEDLSQTEQFKRIRESYLELLKKHVPNYAQDNNYENFGLRRSQLFKPEIGSEGFRGIDNGGCVFSLYCSYIPDFIKLDISSCYFDINNMKPIAESGAFLTISNGEKFRTHLRFSENFRLNSGYNANHRISRVLREIQESGIIPHISEEDLSKIPI